MPRTKGIPAYGLHKPTGQARVRIGGKDHYLGPHGSEESKQQYEQIVRKLITERAAEGVRARVEIATDLTISELVASYIQHAKTYYVKDGRQTTEFGDIARTLRPIREQYGHELVAAFGPLKLKAIREQWVAAALVRTQINAKVRRVRRMFAWGVEQELVPPAVLQAIKAVQGLKRGRTEAREGKRVLPVLDAYVDAVRPFVSRQIWAMIELQRLAGMRPQEVCLMRTIDINTNGAIWEYQPRRHKTEHHERERIVPLGPRAQEVLKPWLRTELEASNGVRAMLARPTPEPGGGQAKRDPRSTLGSPAGGSGAAGARHLPGAGVGPTRGRRAAGQPAEPARLPRLSVIDPRKC